ncbi:MAG: ArsC/Spx/MgsR family protein [Candidatus Sericytochromatia bacterium]|nr:ArsC/Spx/MgsR family protein [Candidatus Sericytochromatia bacterium]
MSDREEGPVQRIGLYVKAGCTTCNKAREVLRGHGVAFTERDVFRHPLDADELLALAALRTLRALFSDRSPSARALGLDPDALPASELIGVMLQEPRLIRRPLVRIGDRLVIGCDAAAIAEALRA